MMVGAPGAARSRTYVDVTIVPAFPAASVARTENV
jgi:hypothetical protein